MLGVMKNFEPESCVHQSVPNDLRATPGRLEFGSLRRNRIDVGRQEDANSLCAWSHKLTVASFRAQIACFQQNNCNALVSDQKSIELYNKLMIKEETNPKTFLQVTNI